MSSLRPPGAQSACDGYVLRGRHTRPTGARGLRTPPAVLASSGPLGGWDRRTRRWAGRRRRRPGLLARLRSGIGPGRALDEHGPTPLRRDTGHGPRRSSVPLWLLMSRASVGCPSPPPPPPTPTRDSLFGGFECCACFQVRPLLCQEPGPAAVPRTRPPGSRALRPIDRTRILAITRIFGLGQPRRGPTSSAAAPATAPARFGPALPFFCISTCAAWRSQT